MPAVATTQQLDQLPLRALLAYAVRCGRRVEGFYRVGDDESETERFRPVIHRALQLAEEFAAGQPIEWKHLAQAEEATVRALLAVREAAVTDAQAAYAANATYAIINATSAALKSLEADDPTAHLDNVMEAVAIAVDAARLADPRVARAAELDWEMLRRMCLGRFPDAGEPVDAAETGILGPLFHDKSRPVRKSAASPKPEPAPAKPHATERSVATSKPSEASTASPEPTSKPRKARPSQKLQAALAELRGKQEALQAEQAALQVERKALQEMREALVSERDLLREKSKTMQAQVRAGRKKIVAANKRIKQLQEQVSSLEAELHSLSEILEAERAAFAEERAQLAAEIQELQSHSASDSAAQNAELQARCAQLEQERDALLREQSEWQRQSADLLAAQEWLLAERQKLEAAAVKIRQERQQLERAQAEFNAARETFQADQVRVAMQVHEAAQTGTASGEAAPVIKPSRKGDTTPIRLLLKPGTASAAQVTDLLRTLATVYQQVSGWTLRFKLREVRLRRLPEDRRNWPDFPESERAIVEFEVSPRALNGGPETRFDLARWNQFRTCLLIALRLDGDLTRLFAEAHGSPKDHHARLVMAEVLPRLEELVEARPDPRQAARSAIPVDVVNQQLQTLEQSLNRLRLEERLEVELAPLSPERADDTDKSANGSSKRKSSRLRRLFFVTSLLTAGSAGAVTYWF